MNKYDLVMFDMDGTIMDSRNFHHAVFYRFLNEYVRPVTHEEVYKGIGNTVREIFDSIGVEEERLESLFEELDDFCRTQVDDIAKEIPVVPGTKELLRGLKERGIKRALLTNSLETVTDRMLTMNGLKEYFDAVSGADYFSLNKIDRCIRLASKFDSDRILYVGDTQKDMELALSMGYDACFADTGYGWCEDREYVIEELKPTCVAKQLTDILKFI